MTDNLVVLITCGGVLAIAIRAILMERGNNAGPRHGARRARR